MTQRIKLALLFILLLAAAPASAWADAAGVVVRMVGTPYSIDEGTPLRWNQAVAWGSHIRCSGGSQADVVLFANGRRYRIGPGSDATIYAEAVAGPVVQFLGRVSGPGGAVAGVVNGRMGGAVTIGSRIPIIAPILLNNRAAWALDSTPTFAWTPGGEADHFLFTLFNKSGDILWSEKTQAATITYPMTADGVPRLKNNVPYVWEATAYGQSGRPLSSASRWGIVTLLSADDQAKLQDIVRPLEDTIRQHPADLVSISLLIQVYESFGVLARPADMLINDVDRTQHMREIDDALYDVYRRAGIMALALSGNVGPPVDRSATIPIGAGVPPKPHRSGK
ncbi:MAG: hypothetical protein M3Y56_12510 [Armatimonadota bacterium]|nr:hypothetical protein [Armatimonadota bacterium]